MTTIANYAAYRRMGDYVFMSGVVAVDSDTKGIITAYNQLPEPARVQLRALGYDTGQLSVDIFEAPIAAQSWFVLNRIREMLVECGGEMKDVARLVQYFRNLRDYPIYNRVRSQFFTQSVVSTVVEVSRMLPGDAVLVEVEATVYLP